MSLPRNLDKLLKRAKVGESVVISVATLTGLLVALTDPATLVPSIAVGVGVNELSDIINRLKGDQTLSDDDIEFMIRELNNLKLDVYGVQNTLVDNFATLFEELKKQKLLSETVETHLRTFLENLDNVATRENQDAILAKLDQLMQKSPTLICPKPPPRRVFGGRNTETEDIIIALVAGQNSAITAVHGIGGIGKTALANHIANEVFERKDLGFHAVLWMEIGRNHDAKQLLNEWMLKYADDSLDLGLPVEQVTAIAHRRLKNIIETACEGCENPRILVVFDNVWQAGRPSVKYLKQAIPENSVILITTRSTQVASDLDIPRNGQHELIKLVGDDAVAMLRAYFGEIDESVLLPFAESLKGHALALSIASRRIRGKNLAFKIRQATEKYKEGLRKGKSFRDLQLAPEDVENKDENLEKALELSYLNDLTKDDQKRFRQLGVLAPDVSFSAELLQALWQTDSLESTTEYANKLVDYGLLDEVPLAESEIDRVVLRYSQHSILRAYAHALLEKNEQDETFRGYVQYVTQISQFFELPMQYWDSQIGQDYPHIDYVGDLLIAQYDQHPSVYRNLTSNFIFKVRGYVNHRPVLYETEKGVVWRGLEWLKEGVNIYKEINSQERLAEISADIGAINLKTGYAIEAMIQYENSLRIYQKLGDYIGVAYAMNNIGTVYRYDNNVQKALEYFHKVLRTAEETNNNRLRLTALNNLGATYQDAKEYDDALRQYQKVLSADQESNQLDNKAHAFNNIGTVYTQLGDHKKASKYFQEALSASRAIGDRGLEAVVLNSIGSNFRGQGKKSLSLKYFEMSLPIRREVGDRLGEAKTLNNIALIYFQRRKFHQAINIWLKTIPILQQMDSVAEEALHRHNLATGYRKLGKDNDAIIQLKEALSLLRSKDLPHDAFGNTVEYYEIFLANLTGELKLQIQKQTDDPILKQLIELYLKSGESVVSNLLINSGMSKELVAQKISQIKSILKL